MTTEHNGTRKVEDAIDTALTMLRETQPPAAIVSRVHSCLEIGAMSQRARSGRVLLIPAAGLAIAALVLVAIFVPTHRKQRDQTSAVETAGLGAATPLMQATRMSSSATVATKRHQEGKRSVQPPAVRPIRRKRREYRRATNLLSYPLTRQEKLLVEFVRNAKPADLQALNPEYQAKVEAREDAEFAAYLKSSSSSGNSRTTQNAQE